MGIRGLVTACFCGWGSLGVLSAQVHVPMSFWFADATEHAGPTLRDWTQLQFVDLDADGKVDQVLLDNRGLQVAWGLGSGAFGPTALLLPAKGDPTGFVLAGGGIGHPHSPFERQGDGLVPTVRVFVLERNPGWVRVGEIQDRRWKNVEDWDAQGAWRVQGSPYGVVIGPDDNGVITLDKDGVRKRLKGSVLPGARIRVDDWNGDGLGDVMLEHPVTHALGVVWSGLEEWGEVGWLPGTAGTVSWELFHRGIRPPGVLQMDGVSGAVSLYQWKEKEGWVGKEIPQLSGSKQFWSLDTPQLENCVFLFRQMMHSLVLYRLEEDEVVDSWSLTEWPQIRNIQVADWEGDGDMDVVGELENAQFFVQPWLGKVVDRLPLGVNRPVVQIWDVPAVRNGQLKSVPFPLDMPAVWTSGLPPECSRGPAEWGVHDAQLLVAVEDGVLERTPLSSVANPPATTRNPEVRPDPADPKWKPCLSVDYLEFRKEEEWPCLAYIEPGEWYQVTYVRRKDLSTEVWVNGELAYQGQSHPVRYQHRTLTVGAMLGTVWEGISPVIMDDIRITRDVMPADAVPQWIAQGDRPVVYNAGIPSEVRFAFDGLQPLQAESYDYEWVLMSGAGLTEGFTGKGLATDGEHGLAYTGMGEYTDEIVLSFRFKWTGNRQDIFAEDVGLASLHGMFNISFEVVPGWLKEGGCIRGPQSMDSRWMGEGGELGLFHAFGSWGGVGKHGELWFQREASWERQELVGSLPHGERQGSPWVWKHQVQALFGEDPVLYTLDVRERRWTREGPVHPWLTGVDRLIQAGDWLFWIHSQEGRSGWLDLVHQKVFLVTEGGGPWDPRWVGGFSRDGVVVMFDAEGEEREFLPPSGEAAMGGEDFRVLSCWYNFWFLVLLLSMLGALGWRVRKTRMARSQAGKLEPEPVEEGDWGGIATEERERLGLAAMQMLVDFEGQILDTQTFDNVIGIASIDTDETRRSRRSRFILIVNSWSQRVCGEDAVVRQQDPTDRRRVLYAVSRRATAHWRQLNRGESPRD
jgi:hypothetical protein